MDDEYKRLFTTLESGRVTRYHAAPTVQPQTNAMHQWGCALIARFLMDGLLSQEQQNRVVMYMLLHDAAEYITGDIPFTAKKYSKELKALTDQLEEKAFEDDLLSIPFVPSGSMLGWIAKMSDILEGLLWCMKTESECNKIVASRWYETARTHIGEKAQVVADFLKGETANTFFDIVYRATTLLDLISTGGMYKL